MPEEPPKVSFVPHQRDLTTGPGKWRWAIKTGADPAAAGIVGKPKQETTIADLTAAPAPAQLPPAGGGRVSGDVEGTVWELSSQTTTLTGYKYESDQDYHLVVMDTNRRTMIVEIPDPTLLDNANPCKPLIAAARGAFDAKFGLQIRALKQLVEAQPPNLSAPMIVQVSVPVDVTGIGFFDELHGQDGVASNGVELHPVLSITF